MSSQDPFFVDLGISAEVEGFSGRVNSFSEMEFILIMVLILRLKVVSHQLPAQTGVQL